MCCEVCKQNEIQIKLLIEKINNLEKSYNPPKPEPVDLIKLYGMKPVSEYDE
jgi:hypothetical protein